MRKTKAIRQKVEQLRSIDGVKEVVWLEAEGYYTYHLYFSTKEEAEQHVKISAHMNVWVEYLGYSEIECENEYCPSFWVKGYVLEVTFLE